MRGRKQKFKLKFIQTEHHTSYNFIANQWKVTFLEKQDSKEHKILRKKGSILCGM